MKQYAKRDKDKCKTRVNHNLRRINQSINQSIYAFGHEATAYQSEGKRRATFWTTVNIRGIRMRIKKRNVWMSNPSLNAGIMEAELLWTREPGRDGNREKRRSNNRQMMWCDTYVRQRSRTATRESRLTISCTAECKELWELRAAGGNEVKQLVNKWEVNGMRFFCWFILAVFHTYGYSSHNCQICLGLTRSKLWTDSIQRPSRSIASVSSAVKIFDKCSLRSSG